MGDASIWSLLRSPGPPLYIVALLVAVTIVRAWPAIMATVNEARRDKTAERSGDWSRLRAEIARLDERCDHLQREVDECREREAEWMNRAIRAESALLGKGEVKQEAQRIVSRERQIDAAKRERGDGK